MSKDASTSVADEQIPEWAIRYKARDYPQWSLTVDVLAVAVDLPTEALQAAIVIRGEPPYEKYQAWPGGFVKWKLDRDGLAAARRELREETQQEHDVLFHVGTYDAAGRDPRQWAGHRGEDGTWASAGTRVVSRAFLAPLRKEGRKLAPLRGSDAASSLWAGVYSFLPWEDLRGDNAPEAWAEAVRDLERWADSAAGPDERRVRRERIERLLSLNHWNEEEVGARWRLLMEARLVEEATRDKWGRADANAQKPVYGRALAFDHREILADALEWLRVEIKRQPALVGALMPEHFKLSELQTLFEAVAGRRVYRTNFRRLVTKGSRIVEGTDRTEDSSGPGRPAEYYRLTASARHARYSPGLTLPLLPLTV